MNGEMVYMAQVVQSGVMSLSSVRKRQAAQIRAHIERIERFMREQDERMARMRL